MITIYTVDAFTRELFKGNPAGVCTSFQDVPSSSKLDKFFQQIATEMNISETAFITKANDSSSNARYFLQWFTPTNEVDLCGHATLSTAHILFEQYFQNNSSIEELIFETKKVGELKVKKCDNQGRLQLDFPQGDPQPIDLDNKIMDEIKLKLNIKQQILDVQLCKRTKKLLIQLSSLNDDIKPQESLTDIKFDSSIQSFIRGIILTSKSIGTSEDFISRYFAPWNGILEDPVTGSAHTVLAVYWSRLLNQSILNGYQKSDRGGYVECELDQENQRVFLRGYAVTVLQGQLQISRNSFL